MQVQLNGAAFCLIKVFYVLHGLIHQFLLALPNPYKNDLAGVDTEPNINLVESGSISWREVKSEPFPL